MTKCQENVMVNNESMERQAWLWNLGCKCQKFDGGWGWVCLKSSWSIFLVCVMAGHGGETCKWQQHNGLKGHNLVQ